MFSAITFALFLLVCNAYAQLSYGIFGYYPTGAVPMLPGFNQRLYNRVESLSGSDISLDMNSGKIALQKGVYRVTGFSIVRWIDLADHWAPPDMDQPPTGYCVVMSALTGHLTTCSVAVAIYNQQSTFDLVVEVNNTDTIFIQHQCGQNVTNLYFGLDQTSTHNHVYARVSVFRLD